MEAKQEPMKVVIAGGSSGIGEATARHFLTLGAQVTITGRDPARLEAARARLGAVRAELVDGRDAAAARALFERLGPFDHLVLALTGGKGAGPFGTLSLDDIRAGLEAKLFAQLTTLQAALPVLQQSVTFITAASARAALPGTAGLAAVNGAIQAMVPPLAAELAPIRVNAVSPGIVDTPWWDAMPAERKQAFFQHAVASLPVRRVGQPGDVAAAIAMLACNAFITGTVLDVSGGVTLAR
ncbi:MAG TPA: SDR family oxidoreductase [Haliangium sp.]|nr:SDR family oxidoreductase [Haliangium sp.]